MKKNDYFRSTKFIINAVLSMMFVPLLSIAQTSDLFALSAIDWNPPVGNNYLKISQMGACNYGPDSATAKFDVSIILKDETSGTIYKVSTQEIASPSIASGNCHSVYNLEGWIDQAMDYVPSGTYVWGVWVDSGNDYTESNENNNFRLLTTLEYTSSTPLQSPEAPTNLQASSGKNESAAVHLTWTDNANNETGFKVERSTDGNNFSEIADLNMNSQSYEDASANEHTAYHYRVLAYNATGNSAFSNVAEVTTGTSGFADIDNKWIAVYPNPAKTLLYFSNIEELNITSSLQLFDISGRLITEKFFFSNQVSITELQTGFYIGKFSSNKTNYTFRFLKE